MCVCNMPPVYVFMHVIKLSIINFGIYIAPTISLVLFELLEICSFWGVGSCYIKKKKDKKKGPTYTFTLTHPEIRQGTSVV